jgi:hypothetical protein
MALSQSAALHDVTSRRAASRALTATHPLGSEHQGSRRPAGSCAVELLFLPTPLAPRASHPWAPVPPYRRRAAQPTARRRTRRTSPPPLHAWPCHDPYPDLVPLVRKKTSPNRLAHGYKAGRSSLAWAPSRRRPPWMPYGELHPACFSSQTRAAPHSTRTPSSSCARLLACPSRRLTGASAPAAAAGQSSTGSASRSSPEPTNHLNTSPRPP